MRLLRISKIMGFGKTAHTTDGYLQMAVCSFFFLFCVNTTHAKGFFFFGWGTEVYTVKEMPDDYMIQTPEYGEIHANLGVIYNEFTLFWIPVWNWNVEKYVFLPDNYKTLEKGRYVFYDIDADEFQRLQQMVGDLPEIPKLSFWRSVGGKLIFLPFILLFLYGLLSPSTNKEETEENYNNNKQ